MAVRKPRYMKHPFLFQPGSWSAKGTYTLKGETVPAEGRTTVTHQEEVWIVDGSMRLQNAGSDTFSNRYEVTPFRRGRTSTPWRSSNPALGTLFGDFTLTDETIISTFVTEDGACTGVEILTKRSETEYIAEGHLEHEHVKVGAWSMVLMRTPGTGPAREL